MRTGGLGNLAKNEMGEQLADQKIEDSAMLLVNRSGRKTRLERSLPEAATFSRDVVACSWLLTTRI